MIEKVEVAKPRVIRRGGYDVEFDLSRGYFTFRDGDSAVFALSRMELWDLQAHPVETHVEYRVGGLAVSRDTEEHTVTLAADGWSLTLLREEARMIGDGRVFRVAHRYGGSCAGEDTKAVFFENRGQVDLLLIAYHTRLRCSLSVEAFGQLQAYLMRITEPTQNRGYMYEEGPY